MYRRFLNKGDYLGIITETALSQLVRDNDSRFEQAEQAAEASIVDYLSENYEIERELNRGKFIFNYDKRISYPIGTHFYLDGKICEVIKAINGTKSPSANPYWHLYEGDMEPRRVETYSQLKNYHVGDMVCFHNVLFECDIDNGIDFNDMRIPGIEAWAKVEVYDWEAIPYQLWEVVRYEGKFFTLMTTEGYEEFSNPMESDCWGMIGDYDASIDTYELSEHEYVVFNDEVFYPLINPNADIPELERNIRYHDPRNYNLKRHMVQLALYELHKLISPNNVSSVRVDDYEHSMQWLKDASRLKLNPQIPRKVGRDEKPITDWQMATFQTDYDPYTNPWHV
jgi:hypothetical protein